MKNKWILLLVFGWIVVATACEKEDLFPIWETTNQGSGDAKGKKNGRNFEAGASSKGSASSCQVSFSTIKGDRSFYDAITFVGVEPVVQFTNAFVLDTALLEGKGQLFCTYTIYDNKLNTVESWQIDTTALDNFFEVTEVSYIPYIIGGTYVKGRFHITLLRKDKVPVFKEHPDKIIFSDVQFIFDKIIR